MWRNITWMFVRGHALEGDGAERNEAGRRESYMTACKMFTRSIGIWLLVLILALGVAACGGSSSPTSPSGSPAPTQNGY